MGNPFDFLTGGSSGSSDTPTTPTAPSPLDRALRPEGGGALGLLGNLFGVKTGEERKADAEAATMQQLSGYLQASQGNPQQAIMKFVGSDEGKKLMSQPGAVDVLEKWTKAITPPPPTGITTGPGQHTDYSQNGQPAGSVSQPTSEVQAFNAGVPQNVNVPAGSKNVTQVRGQPTSEISQPTDTTQNYNAGVPQIANTGPGEISTPFVHGQPQQHSAVKNNPTTVQTYDALTSRLSHASPATLDQLAINTLNPGAEQQQSLALQSLVQQKIIPQADADRILAKTLQIIPETNDVGEKTGRYIFYDMASKKTSFVTPGVDPSQVRTLPSQTGGTPIVVPNSATQPDGSINANAMPLDRKYMGLGVGPGAMALSMAGTALRWLQPGNNEPQSQLASMRQQQLSQLDTMLVALGAQDGRLKVQTSAWKAQAPSSWTDPIDAYNKLILLHQNVTGLISTENQTYQDRSLPIKIRTEAQENIQRLSNVLSMIPTVKDSQEMLKNITAGTAGAVTPESTARSLIDMGSQAGQGIVKTGKRLMNGQEGSQPARKPAAAPDVNKMDQTGLMQYGQSLKPGPSAERTSYENRLRQLIQSKKTPGKQGAAQGNTKVAGDLLDRSQEFRNLQESNGITRSLDRQNQIQKPKAPVLPIRPKPPGNPFSQVG